MPDTEPMPETATEMHLHNPVYKGYFADPFVGVPRYIMRSEALRKRKDKWMKSHARVDSTDELYLSCAPATSWHFAGNALRPDPALGDNFWAPEIAYCDGKFYLYYSVGHEDGIISCALPPAIAAGAVSRRRTARPLGLPLRH